MAFSSADGTAHREHRQRLPGAVRRREINVVLVWLLDELTDPRVSRRTKNKKVRAHRLANSEECQIVDPRRGVE